MLSLSSFCLLVLVAFVSFTTASSSDVESSTPSSPSLYTINGKVYPPEQLPSDWYWKTHVVIDGGKKMGFVKDDNTFAINGLLSGSYLLEVVNPDFFYEPIRVDINSKGKVRARKVNNVQPTQVTQVPYPLKLKSLGKVRYFQKREEWKITDMLMNPMVLMMILPLLLITVLPKMMNDPETKKEMEQMQQNMNVQNQMPEFSEIMTNLFSGGQAQAKKKPKPITSRR
jgi:hypothetical protein